jgi:transcriptional regulator with XRE-family HTH domain
VADTINKLLAGNIKQLRKKKRWKQPDLAAESGVSLRGIQDIERGIRNPRTKNLAAIAEALGVKPEDLYKDQTEIILPQLSEDQIKAIVQVVKSEMAGEPKATTKRDHLIRLVNELADDSLDRAIALINTLMNGGNKRKNTRVSGL